MKEIQFTNKYMIFLYAYLRQLDLSLDRSLWGKWSDLQAFYVDQLQPKAVADSMIKNSGFNPGRTVGSVDMREPNFLQKCRLYLYKAISGNTYLTTGEAQYCYQLLLRFDEMLHSDSEVYSEEIGKLRVDVAKFYYINVIRYRLLPRDRNRAMYIECFLQSENIAAIKMEEFTKDILL